MKCYLIAGESSGDLHGSNLIKGIKNSHPQAEIRFWGGNKMAKASGTQPIVPLEKMSFMGFTEVILHLPQILSNFRRCKADLEAWQPDVLILIDFPGFNLRIARWAHKKGIRVFYYIAPQAWAWKKGRVKKMRESIDHLFVILPFEKVFFEEEGISHVHYEGHPLKDVVDTDSTLKRPTEGSQIALLPGSRQQEVSKILPIMCQVAKKRPHQHFTVAAVDHIEPEFYENILRRSRTPNVTLTFDGPSALLPQCQAAIVTSGTATLETALHSIPQLVVYTSSRISYEIARRVIQVPFISLVNLILDREAVPELIQSECNPNRIDHLLTKIESDEQYRTQFQENYRELHSKLGEAGVSQRIADRMLELLGE